MIKFTHADQAQAGAHVTCTNFSCRWRGPLEQILFVGTASFCPGCRQESLALGDDLPDEEDFEDDDQDLEPFNSREQAQSGVDAACTNLACRWSGPSTQVLYVGPVPVCPACRLESLVLLGERQSPEDVFK